MSLRSWNAPFGRSAPLSAPAPRGSSVVVASRPATTQCQKPLGVGASGSKQVTTKPLVSAGNPDQDSCGEVLPVAAANCSPSRSPSRISVLDTVKLPTAGSNEYGSGAWGRSRDTEHSSHG